MTFQRSITPSSLTLTLTDPSGQLVGGQLGYDSATRKGTFTTAAPLRAGTVYTATVDATSAAGVAMTTPRTWTFTIIDTEPPTVGLVTPPDGATDAAPGTRVSAVFEGGIEPGTALFTLTNRTTGALVAGSTTYDAATRTATFTPAATLAELTGYTASVSARNTAGLSMAAPQTWQFRTADEP